MTISNMFTFERKVQSIARSYLVTLPKAWCNNFQIKKGAKILLTVKSSGELVIEVQHDKTN